MISHQFVAIKYYTFGSLENKVIRHAVFTRQGGVSPHPWSSLNLGGTVGDDKACVQENRRRVFSAAQLNQSTLYDVWQVHGEDVAIATEPRQPHIPHQKADVILTDIRGITLLMRFADCVPILLYDPIQKVIGIAHAGWQGTLRRVVKTAIETMKAKYSSQPGNILAAIGPSIGPDHYTVGMDVAQQVEQIFGTDASGLLHKQNGEVKFNLWAANRLLLEQVGVSHIEESNICTACHIQEWYSHRGEHGKTGRFGVLISLVD